MKCSRLRYLSNIARGALWIALMASPALVRAQSLAVALGQHGGSVTLVATASGGYTLNGRPVTDGFVVSGSNGLRYVLTVSGARPSATFLPRLVRVPLGTGGSAITLRQVETGGFWWGGGPVSSGLTVSEADGTVFRIVRQASGEWRALFVPESVSLELGESGETIVVVRTEDGGFTFQGSALREGRTVLDSAGRSYQFVLRGGTWRVDRIVDDGGPTVPPPPPLESDRREAYVGVRPVLTSVDGEAVLRVGGEDYVLADLARDGGVTRTATYAEHATTVIERIRGQIETLSTLLEDDQGELRTAIRLRWSAAQDALDEFFGSSRARGILGTLPTRSNGGVDLREVEDTLDDTLLALSSLGEFRAAVDGGIFSRAVDEADADDAYDAVRSTTRLEFGTTANTRFGVYARQERDGSGSWDDDLELLSGTDGFGTFAYSPVEAVRRSFLPSSGEAQFLGSTVAIEPDDPTVAYTGSVELNVRFSANRVVAVVRDLVSDAGDPWRLGAWRAEEIILPVASLDRDDGSFDSGLQTAGATVRYPAFAGSPRPRTLRGELEGQLVGEGARSGGAAIGVWSVSERSSSALIAGAFGAEYDSSPSTPLPGVDDSGEAARTYLTLRPDSGGTIEIGDLDFQATDLFASGFALEQGDPLMDVAETTIERQVELIDLYADAGLGSSEFRQRRREVWDQANDTLFETVFGGHSRARDLLGSSYPTDRSGDQDDDEARDILREAAAALASPFAFEDALDSGGVFAGARSAVDDVDDMFDVLEHQTRVDYGHTDYGRFGVWVRTVGESAREGTRTDPDSPPGAFAYSPLAQTTYFSGDPAYPTRGLGTYEGETLAVEDGVRGRVFAGQIGLTVQWGTRASSASVNAVIRDLRNIEDDRPLVYRTAAVDQIIFQGVRVTSGSGGAIGFDTRSPDVRVRFLDIGRSDARWSGSREFRGKFVGETIDGPLGVIGTWSLGSSFSIPLEGAFAGDWVP